MECYFIITTYIEENKDASDYDEYIKLVMPIVKRYGGEYLVRTNVVENLSTKWNPDRVIIIKFPDRESLNKCFTSKEYIEIKNKRENSVDARAIIAGGYTNENNR